jgi:hypothetical protein
MKNKIMVLVLSLTFSVLSLAYLGSASAAVSLEAGSFVPVQCGVAVSGQGVSFMSPVEKLCKGYIIGGLGFSSFVEITMLGGDVKRYQIENKQSYLMAMDSGYASSVVFLVDQNGNRSALRVIETGTGDFVAVSGFIGEIPYVINRFEFSDLSAPTR